MSGSDLSRRLAYAAALLAVISIVGFLLLRLMPGDFAEALLSAQMDGELPDTAALAKFKAENGFDDPLPQQFFHWLAHALSGDLGRSFITGDPVAEEVFLRLQYSLLLAVTALAAALLLALPTGILCALRPGGWLDRICGAVAMIGMAIPNFWFALLVMLLFALVLGWLPSSGYDSWQHIVLPALVIGTSVWGVLSRYIRRALIEETGQNYMRTARAKGHAPVRGLLVHAMPNAMPGILTVTGIQFARVFDGMIVVETVFGWPGLGRLLVEALLSRDFPLIQGCFLVIAGFYVLVNLMVDLLIARSDPRARGVV